MDERNLQVLELKGEILLFQAEDGHTRLEVQFQGETVWLTQAQMADLFQTSVPNINMHIRNVYDEGELSEGATIKDFLIVRQEGTRRVQRKVASYSLDLIIAVGYRVKSPRGTQFRIWATERLREYMLKGFVMDDDRLKRGGGGVYFEELLARIRDIRSSEKVFWRKVLDIYATSIDYDPSVEASQRFFATVQNKMHWAAHGQTAAEVIHARADAAKPQMGLTAWEGSRPRKADAAIAKLDDFLRLSGRNILTHAGKISHEIAAAKAEVEFEQFRAKRLDEPTRVEKDFEEAIKKLPMSSPKEGKRSRKQ